jgi:hypothetical protein
MNQQLHQSEQLNFKTEIKKQRKHYEKSQHNEQEGNPPADMLQETTSLSVETTD